MNWKGHLLAACLAAAPLATMAAGWQSDLLPVDRVLVPDGAAKGVAVILSDAQGWAARDQAVAETLKAQGIASVGVDLPGLLKKINAMKGAGDCAYLVSDIESLSQQIQRASGSVDYVAPVVAGVGLGGGLALDIVDQTPDVTVGATVAADPASAVPLTTDLCTPAGYMLQLGGEVYALPKGHLADPVTVLLSPKATPDIVNRVTAFKAQSPDVTVAQAEPTAEVMAKAISDQIETARAAMAALPVKVLKATPKHDVMAIILSGDGGWRDLDQSIGEIMQKRGIPVIGLDSLRYFWSKRSPEETGKAIASLIQRYQPAFGVKHVILVGYSFGADVIPASFVQMPKAAQDKVALVSLLGLSTAADWTITVSGWLGSHGSHATPTLPAVKAMPLDKVQCIYGADEDDTGCPALGQAGGEALKVQGGHHFDGNYANIEKAIMAAYKHRVGAQF
ncbi:MAG: virulence factor family protein [Paracoccaceae bacterium]|nr:virulence factor family protein [Paracoccaceae bacterium]MDE3123036.1 virulence factor family protein [Paracoccaceae bacterium]MDE3240090.1 virulence factor family protein [Paracoccaceae bacterium]